ACANVYPRLTSYYWWEGKLEEDQEASLIFKTSAAKVEKLIERIKELHSYSCPCVLAWPIEKGNQDFISWVLEETQR
ncbi:MAG: divalent-cation tolerance protein CutA, partial [Thermodesulfobacteria bacterium]|nr:divalent-cation tolerance protein CutA [Thermodesulfobacteriota bacterium]